jgi:hypothetical protein
MQLILNNGEIVELDCESLVLYVNEEDQDNFYTRVPISEFKAIIDMPYWWFDLSAIGFYDRIIKIKDIKEIKC